MSILIKDLKMPENCFHCPMGYRYGDVDDAKLMCTITAKVIPLGKSLDIMKNCPLVEIQPYSKLIDANMVYQELLPYSNSFRKSVLKIIENIPTVIESEEQEHETT